MFICSDNSWYSWITRPDIVSYCIESGCDTDVSTISWFNIKISSYQYRKSHCGDKTVVLLNRGPVFEPKISRRAGYEVPVVIILEKKIPNLKMELQFILFVSTNIQSPYWPNCKSATRCHLRSIVYGCVSQRGCDSKIIWQWLPFNNESVLSYIGCLLFLPVSMVALRMKACIPNDRLYTSHGSGI